MNNLIALLLSWFMTIPCSGTNIAGLLLQFLATLYFKISFLLTRRVNLFPYPFPSTALFIRSRSLSHFSRLGGASEGMPIAILLCDEQLPIHKQTSCIFIIFIWTMTWVCVKHNNFLLCIIWSYLHCNYKFSCTLITLVVV